jgi:predicted metal-dependent HD superfamily phosphohydrolase
MHAFGVGPNLDTYKHLLIAYSEPHRHYHTTDHIIACLRQLDGALDLAIFPAEVEVALWFHDAIYSPAASENESRSAEWAAQFLSSAGVSREACQRVHQHIMATRHEAQPADSDSNSHFGRVLAGFRFGRRVREAAQHENEQRVPTIEA